MADGQAEAIEVIGRFRYLAEDAKGMPYIKGLMWLVRNGLIGMRFMEYFKIQNEGSILKMAAAIRKGANGDYQLRPIIAKGAI